MKNGYHLVSTAKWLPADSQDGHCLKVIANRLLEAQVYWILDAAFILLLCFFQDLFYSVLVAHLASNHITGLA